jgi:predicted aspartyl protease
VANGRCMGRLLGALAVAGALAAAMPGLAQQSALSEAPASTPTPADGGATTRDVILTTDFAHRMTLPVYVAGKGPYPFLIDTGSQRTLMSAELAGLLTLQQGAAVRIISLSGPAMLPTATVTHLRYGEEEVRDLTTLLVAETHLGGPGILGLDGLKGKKLVLNFAAQRMEVGDSAPHALKEEDGAIVVRARNRMGQLILVNTLVGGLRTSVILDTGAQYSVGNLALLGKLRADRLALPPAPVRLLSVTGDSVEAQMAVVKAVTVGDVVMHDVPVIFTDAAPFRELRLVDRPAMFLGMQILRLFDRIAIDFERKRVDFQMPKPARTEAQRSGGTDETG